jgi:hypothetical protein
MATCPNCGAKLKDDYGMVSCESCQSILFIDMDGNANLNLGDLPPGEPIFPGASPEPGGSTPADYEMKYDQGLPALESDAMGVGVAGGGDRTEPGISSYVGSQQVTPASDANDPLGLSSYANSEVSMGKDGLLLFDVLVEGIDSKEVREMVREVMSDRRFAWNADELLKNLSRGVLRLGRVSPVKASILINRLKHLPIRIKWEQHAITELES